MPIWESLWPLNTHFVRSTTVYPQTTLPFFKPKHRCGPSIPTSHNAWALYNHFRSLSRALSTTLYPPSSPPYKHLRSGEHYPYIYSITHFTVLLRIQLLSMIYWYHNWFYLNYNPTSLPMHSLSFVHHVKGTSCQCPRPTTHLQAMILCPQQSLLLICVHGRACVPIILWCTLQEENEFRIQLLIV